ncbi:hypothetical protein SSX86_030930 [Deinandra increscens subsp. villosa]|uniref:Uncharacterized protein n=1 Tax=Deinandra increscens subsp. villosa TaxID=3103831 RepID=A0AAP0C9X4_9ASTR
MDADGDRVAPAIRKGAARAIRKGAARAVGKEASPAAGKGAAPAYRLEDEEYKKKVHARNVLENYIYDVQREIKRPDNRIQKNHLQKLENIIANASPFLNVDELGEVDVYEKLLNQIEAVCVSGNVQISSWRFLGNI